MAKEIISPLYNHKILKKGFSSLLWILLFTLIFLIPFYYSPNPFRATPIQDFSRRVSDGHDRRNRVFNQGISDDDRNDLQVFNQRISAADEHVDDNDDESVACDLFKGKWVREVRELGYTNRTCSTIPESKNCGKYGKDPGFMNWRWKPDGCELARFKPRVFLEIVRGKKLAFVGDSVARNQMESLLCLLSQAETPTDVFKDSEDRIRTWHFPSHDFTLMVLWTKFLVVGSERITNGSNSGVYDLHLDKIDTNWTERLHSTDYVVISDAHWFFRKLYLHEGNKLIGCVFCSEPNVTDHGVSFAVRRAFSTSLRFLRKCEECGGLLTLVRTFSPAHFENGVWNSGGFCNRTEPRNEEDVTFSGTDWDLRSAQLEEVAKIEADDGRRAKRFGVLDVTMAMMTRADGHPGLHWNNEWNRDFNDCVHWCMPGPIDMWNDLLLAVLKKYKVLEG